MALEPPNDSVGDVLASTVEEGLLTLSTIHSAKGLEWRVVFGYYSLLLDRYAIKAELTARNNFV